MACFVGAGALSLFGTLQKEPFKLNAVKGTSWLPISIFMVASCMFACLPPFLLC